MQCGSEEVRAILAAAACPATAPLAAAAAAWEQKQHRWRQRNSTLNKLALVCQMWHTLLTPYSSGGCMRLLRPVTLHEAHMLDIAHIRQQWWKHLRAYQDATDSGIHSLTIWCPTMTALDLSWCEQLTDAALACLGDECTALTHLNLSECIEVTDLGISNLLAGCDKITHLRLRGCILITDAALVTLATGCAQLTHLELSECVQLTDVGLKRFASGDGCASLAVLDLSDCIWITDEGLQSLAASCTNLAALDVTGCTQITHAGLGSLSESCPVKTSLPSLAVLRAQQHTEAATRIQSRLRGKAARVTAGLMRAAARKVYLLRLLAGTPEDACAALQKMSLKDRFAAVAAMEVVDQVSTLVAMPSEDRVEMLAGMSMQDRSDGQFRGHVHEGLRMAWATKTILYAFLKGGSAGLMAGVLGEWQCNKAAQTIS